MASEDWPMRGGNGRGPQGRGDVWREMHDGMNGWGWGGWLLMVLLGLLLLALIIGIVVLVARSAAPPPPAAGPDRGSGAASPAEHLLDERFARGEIDEEEYLRRRSVLRGG